MTQHNLDLFSRPFREGRGFRTWNCVSSPDIGSRELCQHVQNWTELSITISRLARTLLGFASCGRVLLENLPPLCCVRAKDRSWRLHLGVEVWNSLFRFSRFWLPELGFDLGIKTLSTSANPRNSDAFACPLPGAASLDEVMMRYWVLYVIVVDVTNVFMSRLLTLVLMTRQRTPERMLRGA